MSNQWMSSSMRFGGLSMNVSLGALLGVLLACGPTPPSESLPLESLPFHDQDIIRRARTGLGAAHASGPVISPEMLVSTAPTQAFESAVAAGHGLYLVVWTDEYQYRPHVLAVRVRASDGAMLDSSPIPIGSSRYPIRGAPAVAFDGSNFLVLWQSQPQGPTSLIGTRVRASDGAVLGPSVQLNPPTCCFTTSRNYNPSVAFDGTNYLVAWWGEFTQYGPGNRYGVQVNLVRPSTGQPLETYSLPVAVTAEVHPQVAYSGGRYLVVWSQSQGLQGKNVVGVRIEAASRRLLDATPLPIASTPEDEHSPVVASNGSDFLVVWQGAGGHLKGARVRGVDGAVLDGTGFSVAGPALAQASVTFDGQDYRVAWQATGPEGRGLFSTRVSPEGQVEDSAGFLVSPVHASTTTWDVANIAAVEPGRFLVVYPQYEPSRGWDLIKARRVEDVASEPPCEEEPPTLVLTGAPEMTMECDGTPYSDPGAQAWDGCGNPLLVRTYNSGQDAHGPGPNTSAEGSYPIQYMAWDALGRTVSALRTVDVEDRVAPVLKLKGAATMTHTCGSNWVDPWVEATDRCYGDVAPTVETTGYVNGWAEGTYTVQYRVTDSGGNTAPPVSRTVDVVNCPW